MATRSFCGVCTGFPNYLMTKRIWLNGYAALPLFTVKKDITLDSLYVANFNISRCEPHTCLTYKDLMEINSQRFPPNRTILPGFFVSPVVLQDDKAFQYRTASSEWKKLIQIYIEILQGRENDKVEGLPVTLFSSSSEEWLAQLHTKVKANIMSGAKEDIHR